MVPTAFDPVTMATGDFNGDGIPDLAYTSNGNNTTARVLSILLGKGDGTFTQGQSISLPSGICTCAINIADVNGDGKLDLILGGGGQPQVSIALFPGNGDGTFGAVIVTTFTPLFAGMYPSATTRMGIGDINGDGAADIVVGDQGNNQIYVLTGNNSGFFQLARTIQGGNNPREIFLPDLNGDGHLDIVAYGQAGGTFTVLLGQGDGTFSTGVNYSASMNAPNMVLIDLDGDGHLDAVATTYQISANGVLTSQVSVLLGKADGTFASAKVIVNAIQGSLLDVGDYNGDGVLDLLFLNNTGLGIALGQGNLTYGPIHSYLSGASTYSNTVSGDFNRDGHRDVLMSVEGGIAELFGKGDGSFASLANYDLGQNVGAVAVADFNGDGKPDIAAAVPATYPRLLLGKGDGSFQLATDQNASYTSIAPNSGLSAGDFNGDGIADLVASAAVSTAPMGVPYVFFGKGDGSFAAPVEVDNGSVAVADFNLDGRSDMVSVQDSTIDTQLGQTGGSFKLETSSLRNPTFAKLTAIGDLNRDGKPDLVITDQGGMEIWLGNGDGTFTYSNAIDLTSVGGIASGNFPSSVLADLDGDGNLGLILGPTNLNNGTGLLILYGKGDGSFEAPGKVILSHSYDALTAAHLSSKSTTDLILSNGAGIAVLRSLSNRKLGSEEHYVAGGAVGPLTVADVNGDGFPDIIVANTGGTTVTVLLNEPTTLNTAGLTPLGLLSISPEPSAAQQAFALTLTLAAPAAGDPVPTGSTSFTIDGTPVGDAALKNGIATLTYSNTLTVGSHTVTATYNGDSAYRLSSFSQQHTVSPPTYSSVTVLTVTPAQALASQTIRMQVTVTAAGTTPAGYVTFLDGEQTLGSVKLYANGNAQFDTAMLTVGTHTIVASYGGYPTTVWFNQPETILASQSAPATVTITSNATQTALTSSSTTATAGTVVTFTAAVSSSVGAPFGGVTFYDGTTQLGTASLENAQATFSIASLGAGSHKVSASFNANGTFAGSSSAPSTISIQAAAANLNPTFTAITQATVIDGSGVFSAHVLSVTGKPQGQVTFLMGGTIVGTATVDQNGNALWNSPVSSASGLRLLHASYSGNRTFAPSVSPDFQQSLPQTGASFSLTLDATSVSVSSTTPATIHIVVAAPASFQQTISISCGAGLPSGYSCSFSPASLTGAGNSVLTIRPAQTASGGVLPDGRWTKQLGTVLLVLFLLPVCKLRSRRWLVLLLIAAPLGMLLGCAASQVANVQSGQVVVLSIQANSGSGTDAIVQSAQIGVRITP
ncbi:MAG: FG-GAP-like repeat-containing protein [Terracidiphilus sp.]|nr:FG-GAP-like repeat-containing protein [Terracidiphilus sp.]